MSTVATANGAQVETYLCFWMGYEPIREASLRIGATYSHSLAGVASRDGLPRIFEVNLINRLLFIYT